MKKNNLVLSIIGLIIFGIMLYVYFPSKNSTNCYADQIFKEQAFEGVVSRKYLDKNQHSVPIIEIKSIQNNRTDKVDLFGEFSGMYNSLNINDTIKKERSTNTVYIRKHGVYVIFGDADFQCETAGQQRGSHYLK